MSSVHVPEAVKRASLVAQVKSLMQRQRLKKMELKLRIEEEELAIETAITVLDAKEKILAWEKFGNLGSDHPT